MLLKLSSLIIGLLRKYLEILGSIYYQTTVKHNLLHCGANVYFHKYCVLEGKEFISIGNNVALGAFLHIWGQGGVTIGNDVMIAAHTSITSLTHDYTDSEMIKTIIKKTVIIEDDVWIGGNVVICPGVRIGKGAVIGAGSVVLKDIKPYTINAGVPARFIKDREIKVSKLS